MPDALDRTVSETETHSGSTTTTATVYQGDSTAVTQETLTGAQTGTKTYAYDASGNAITLSTGSSNRYSYLYDPRSNVSLLVDQAGGVEESYGYSAYGSPNASLTKKASGFSTGAVPTNPVRFQGKRFDSGSASYDMGARRYSPSVGRWLSQDMYYGALDDLGLSQDPLTANRYAFLGANPINYVELDGHHWYSLSTVTRALRRAAHGSVKYTKKGISWTYHEVKRHRLVASCIAGAGASLSAGGCVYGVFTYKAGAGAVTFGRGVARKWRTFIASSAAIISGSALVASGVIACVAMIASEPEGLGELGCIHGGVGAIALGSGAIVFGVGGYVKVYMAGRKHKHK